jgi:hypothetical protein
MRVRYDSEAHERGLSECPSHTISGQSTLLFFIAANKATCGLQQRFLTSAEKCNPTSASSTTCSAAILRAIALCSLYYYLS